MSKTLATSQSDLASRDPMCPVLLVQLDTYINRPTINYSYYWSYPGSIHYDWNGDGDQFFEGVIQEISVPNVSIPFPPQPSGFSSRAVLGLTITNEIDWKTAPLQWYWRSMKGRTLHGASITVAELLVPLSRRKGTESTPHWDLRDLPGTEHTIIYRGELEHASATRESISMRFASPEPAVPFVELLDSTRNDPKDFGSRLPIVVGDMKHVPCKNIEVGWETSIAQTLDDSSTGTVAVTDASGFPTATSFDIMISGEVITCSGSDHDANTIEVTSRGQENTRAVQHHEGELIVELPDEITLGIASHSCVAIPNLYMLNPYTNSIMRYTGSYEEKLIDYGAIAGEKICTIRIDKDSLKAFLVSVSVASQVTVQPVYVDSGASAPTSDQETPATRAAVTYATAPMGEWTIGGSIYKTTRSGLRQYLKASYSGAGLGSTNVDKWRMHVRATVSSYNGGTAYIRMISANVDGIPNGTSIYDSRGGNGTLEAYSAWYEPADGTTMQDLVSDGAFFYIDCSGGTYSFGSYPVVTINEFEMEAELEAASNDISQIVEAEIEGGAVGFGLQFFADVQGAGVPYLYPSSSYSFEEGGSGTWNELGCDQVRVAVGAQEGSYWQRCDTTATTARMQKNDCTAGDLSTTDYRYKISIRATDPSDIESARVYFASLSGSGSGTTVPSNRYELTIPIDALEDDEWADLEIVAVPHGTPDVTNVDCVGIEVIRSGGTPTLGADYLRVASASNANYADDPGDLIENLPDQIRWFIADHCELGHDAIDSTTFGAAITNLGTNVYAGVLTGLGTTFDDIIGRMAWEGRGSIVRLEGSSDTLYKLITSGSAGAYGSSGGTITDFVDCAEEIYNRGELASRFRAFWSWDAHLGQSEHAFAEVTRADNSVSDIAVTTTSLNSAEKNFGRVDADPFFFFMIRDEATAEDVLDFYVRYAINEQRNRMSLEAPHWHIYALEPGDIREVTPLWDDGYPATKCLVLAVYRTPGEPTGRVELAEVN